MSLIGHTAGTYDSAQTRYPHEGMGGVVLAELDLQFIPLDSRQRVDRLRHEERIGSISAHLLFPHAELEIFGSLDEVGGLCRGDNLCLGEGLADDVETKIIIGVVIGHEDILQFLLQSFDFLDDFLGKLFLKLSVDEGSVLLAIDDGGSDGEDSLRSGL